VAAAVVANDDLLAKENAQLSAQGLVDSVAASLAGDSGDAGGQQALLAFGSSSSAASAAIAAAAAALCGDLINNNNNSNNGVGGGGGYSGNGYTLAVNSICSAGFALSAMPFIDDALLWCPDNDGRLVGGLDLATCIAVSNSRVPRMHPYLPPI